jgi:UDP-GlcNAc:undecaprenyl-phosphate GlcNAc-1-phosphate transferase
MLAVLSLMGFKNLTLVSIVVPMIILAVPLLDTIFAIIRRIVNKQPITAADKSHFHHCLLQKGFSHRQAVLIIYGTSIFFSLIAFLFTMTTVWVSISIIIILAILIEVVVEKIGLVNSNYRPLLNLYQQIRILIQNTHN